MNNDDTLKSNCDCGSECGSDCECDCETECGCSHEVEEEKKSDILNMFESLLKNNQQNNQQNNQSSDRFNLNSILSKATDLASSITGNQTNGIKISEFFNSFLSIHQNKTKFMLQSFSNLEDTNVEEVVNLKDASVIILNMMENADFNQIKNSPLMISYYKDFIKKYKLYIIHTLKKQINNIEESILLVDNNNITFEDMEKMMDIE